MIRRLAIMIAMFTMGIQAALVSPACAQDNYPSRTVTIVVGFAAGGTTDIIARLIGQKISESTGANVVIESIGGAASIPATEKVAHATPDGYTLYMPSSTPFAPIRTSSGGSPLPPRRLPDRHPGRPGAARARRQSQLPGLIRPGIRRAIDVPRSRLPDGVRHAERSRLGRLAEVSRSPRIRRDHSITTSCRVRRCCRPGAWRTAAPWTA